LHEGDEARDIVGGDGEARDLGGDAGVAGGADDAGRGGRGEERADERVFTATGADDEEGARESYGHPVKNSEPLSRGKAEVRRKFRDQGRV
jgi:hypothetical protein